MPQDQPTPPGDPIAFCCEKITHLAVATTRENPSITPTEFIIGTMHFLSMSLDEMERLDPVIGVCARLLVIQMTGAKK